jgi:hypothetical protein
MHRRAPAWKASTTVSVRSLLVGLGLALLSVAVLSDLMARSDGYVVVEQERVRFDVQIPTTPSEIYVFYPGLTIEAERESL